MRTCERISLTGFFLTIVGSVTLIVGLAWPDEDTDLEFDESNGGDSS